MAEQKNAKYFIYKDKPDFEPPPWEHMTAPDTTRRVAVIDEETVPGAEFGCECMWLLPGDRPEEGEKVMDAHTLPYGVFIGFFSNNYDDVTDLCGEVELWIGGEKHVINKSFAAFVPAGTEQGPLIVRNITRPTFYFISAPCGTGTKKWGQKK